MGDEKTNYRLDDNVYIVRIERLEDLRTIEKVKPRGLTSLEK